MKCLTCSLEMSGNVCILCGAAAPQVSTKPSLAATLEMVDKRLNVQSMNTDMETAIRQAEHDAKIEEPDTCYHTCPKCNEIYSHDIPEHACKAKYHAGREFICPSCKEKANGLPALQQDVVEINRPIEIEAIKAKLLSGQEISEIMTAHESFVVLNLVHKPDGSLYEDRIERIEQHILSIKRQIENFRVKETAARKVKGTLQIEELSKLSVEEREAYKRAAIRPKKEKKPAESTAGGTKELTMVKALLKKGGETAIPMILKMFPKVTEQQARSLLND